MRHARGAVLALAVLCGAGTAGPARAGLDLTWNAANSAGGDSVVTLGCGSADSVALLYGCFQSPTALSSFYAMDIVLDFEAEAAELPPFWHLDTDGCNRYGVVLSDAMPDSGCAGALNPWGPQGGSAFSFIGGFSSGYNGRSRGRMLCLIARRADQPIPLAADSNYFAFQLRFFFDHAREAGGTCAGCRTPVSIRWVSCTLSGTGVKPDGGHEPVTVVVENPGWIGSCARANGARACAVSAPAAADSLRAPGH
jgi:hypothetical protein